MQWKKKNLSKSNEKTSCLSPGIAFLLVLKRTKGQRTIEFFVTSVSGVVAERVLSRVSLSVWDTKLYNKVLCSETCSPTTQSFFYFVLLVSCFKSLLLSRLEEEQNSNCQLRLQTWLTQKNSRHAYNGNERREWLFLLVIPQTVIIFGKTKRRYETWHVTAIRENVQVLLILL